MGDIVKVKLEYHPRLVDFDRHNQVRVQIALIVVEQEVGVEPVVKCLTLAHAGGDLLVSLGIDGARLQAIPGAICDGVTGVVKNAIQAFMQIGYVVTPIEIVIHEYFPVAFDDPLPSSSKMEKIEPKRLELFNQVAEVLPQGKRLAIKVDENKFFPHVNLQGKQPILLTIKILHPREIRHTLKRSVESIRPPVIWTLELCCCPTWRSHDGRGVMPAH